MVRAGSAQLLGGDLEVRVGFLPVFTKVEPAAFLLFADAHPDQQLDQAEQNE